MNKETFTKEQKREIAKKIKDIKIQDVEEEMNKLIKIGKEAHMISGRSKIGNNVVDYFTFLQRLETKGKYDVNYFEFLENLEIFREKKFIQNMLKYYEDVKNKTKYHVFSFPKITGTVLILFFSSPSLSLISNNNSMVNEPKNT